MTGRQLTWLLAALLAIPATLVAVLGLLGGTQAGTRWLLRAAEPYLPEPLSLGEVHGSLLGGLDVDGVGWIDDGVRVGTGRVRINADLLPLLDGELRIRRLRVEDLGITLVERDGEPGGGGPLEIRLPLTVRLRNARLEDVAIDAPGFARRLRGIELSAVLEASDLDVERLVVDADWLGLDAAGRLRLADRYPATLDARWRYVVDEGGLELQGALDARGDVDRYEVRHELTRPVAVTTTGTIAAPDGAPLIDLVNRWTRIDWPLGERRLYLGRGELGARGTPAALAVTLSASGRIDEWPEAALDLEGRLTADAFSIESATLAGEPGRATLQGRLGRREQQPFDVELQLSELDPSVLSERLSGRVRLQGTASGTLASGRPSVSSTITEIGGTLNDQPLSGHATFSLSDDVLSIGDAALRLGANGVAVSGRLADTLAARVRIDLPELEALDARLGGALAGELSLSGTRSDPAAELRLNGTGASWDDAGAETLSVEAALRPPRSLGVSLEAGGLAFGQTSIESARVSLDGLPEEHGFRLAVDDARGSLSMNGNGRLGDGRWDGELASLEVYTAVLNRWSLAEPVSIGAGRGGGAVSPFCLASTATAGSACARASFDPDAGGDFELTVHELPIDALPLELPAGARITGHLESSIAARLDDAGLSGEGVVELVDSKIEASYDEEPYSLDLTTAALDATLESNRLESSLDIDIEDGAGSLRGRLSVDDVRKRESAVSALADVALPDAAVLGALAPDLSGLRGAVSGGLTAGGSLNAPDFTGELRLSDAGFGVRPAGITIDDLNLVLRQMAPGELALTGSARSGEGTIRIDGSTLIGTDTGLLARLALSGDRFELARLPDLRVAASPDIEVVIDDQVASVSGSLNVPSADVAVAQVPATAARPSGDAIVHDEATAPEQPRRRIDVDVAASLGDQVQFSGFGLTTRISGDVRLRGGTGRPFAGNGSLRLNEGRYKAYGQDLAIESGELIFNGPLSNPRLNVRAVRNIPNADVVAGIRVSGVPTNLSSEVFSEPGMSDAEALSYLLTGRPLSAPTGNADADLMNRAAFALGLSQAGSIASQIKGDLGLDTLTVEGGADAGRIVAGKRFGDRLLVEYGYGLVDKLGILLLRYELTNRFILESRTGTVSEFDVVYSVKRE